MDLGILGIPGPLSPRHWGAPVFGSRTELLFFKLLSFSLFLSCDLVLLLNSVNSQWFLPSPSTLKKISTHWKLLYNKAASVSESHCFAGCSRNEKKKSHAYLKPFALKSFTSGRQNPTYCPQRRCWVWHGIIMEALSHLIFVLVHISFLSKCRLEFYLFIWKS